MVAFQTTELEIQKPQEVERLKPSMITPQHPLLARLILHQYKYMYWGHVDNIPTVQFSAGRRRNMKSKCYLWYH